MNVQNDFNIKPSKWFIITLSALLASICFTILGTVESASAKSLSVFTVIDIDLSVAGTPGKNCDCSHDRYNCSDFANQEDAQACYWACGALSLGDIHRLDLDDNRVACDSPIVNSNCNCDGDFYGCSDFESQEAAQACYWSCGGQGKGDVHQLDPDADLQACEELPIISPLNVFLAAPAKSNEPTHTIAPGSEPNASCDCSADFYNCVDFETQEDAQACYWSCGHQGKGDIHGLDLDINMVACEGLPVDGKEAESEPEPEAEPEPASPPEGSEPNANCDCSADFYNCADFASQDDAQACYWACGAQGAGDIHGLDLNADLVACEELPTATTEADTAEPETAPGPAAPAPEPQPAAPTPTPGPPSTAISGGLASMNSPDFGAQAFLWWRPEVADRDLELMNEAGFNWVKQGFAWEDIELQSGTYNWDNADRVVKQVNDKGLKLLARVGSDPDLTDFWGGHPPGNAGNFARYAGELARRYNCSAGSQGCIHAYQIWNEPNLAREWGGKRPNPAEYVDFLGQAYRAIKAANPNAIVISAGMAPTGSNDNNAMPDDMFYEQMYAAMGQNSDGYFDMLGVHGAGFAAPPELDPAEAASNSQYGGFRFFAFRHVEDIREIMVRNNDSNKKIVLLEFGWTYDSVNPSYKWHGADAGIDAALHGKYLLRAYQYAAANWPWVGLMSLLTMPNLDWIEDGNPEDEEQYWWAILDPSPLNQLFFRPAYVELCIYFNSVRGQRCIYDPN